MLNTDMMLKRLSTLNYKVNHTCNVWSIHDRSRTADEEAVLLQNFVDAKAERDAFVALIGDDRERELSKILKRKYHKTARVRARLKCFFASGKEVYFLTFTFTDEVLQNTSSDTRRQYVRRWLAQNTLDYVGNIDYGDKNNREHYHAVVLCDSRPDMSSWFKSFGGFKCRKVNKDNPVSVQKVPQYINKLSCHSTKNFTACNLLWGRPYQKSDLASDYPYLQYCSKPNFEEFEELPF